MKTPTARQVKNAFKVLEVAGYFTPTNLWSTNDIKEAIKGESSFGVEEDIQKMFTEADILIIKERLEYKENKYGDGYSWEAIDEEVEKYAIEKGYLIVQ